MERCVMREARRWLATLVWAATASICPAQMPGVQVVEKFRVPEFDANGIRKSEVFGDRAELTAEGPIKITGLKIFLYKDGEIDATLDAAQCTFDRKEKMAFSNGDVSIKRGRMIVTGRGFRWSSDTQHISILNNVRVVLEGMPVWTKKERK